MNDITALMATTKAAAEKATQGKWWIDSHGEAVVSFQDGENVLPIFKTDRVGMGPAIRHEDTGNLSHWRNDNDATFIATACPANVLALVEALEKAQQRIAELEGSLGVLEEVYISAADEVSELESRTVTVKLPPRVDSSNVPFTAHTWNCCLDAVEKCLAAAGIQVIEGAGK